MARIIPPYCSEDIKSTGERQMFDALKNDPGTEGWICLHSLGLTKHLKRLYGEIDFLLIVLGEGIFCLEVKSGGVSRKDGILTYRNRYGEVATRTVGPFRQAQEGMFPLIDAIRRKFGTAHRLLRVAYGYGVMFPHISFQFDDPEQEQWMIYDRNSRRDLVSVSIKRLARFTHDKIGCQKWYDPDDSRPTTSNAETLTGFLRGDFEKIVWPSEQMLNTEQRLLRLTEEQYICLDELQAN